MTMAEFVERQGEFKGRTAVFTMVWKDGHTRKTEKPVNCRYCMPSGEFFEVTNVEIKERPQH